MSRSDSAPGAIVVGSGLNALGVIRSLGKGSIKVAAVSGTPSDPPQRSRYSTTRHQAPNVGPEFVDAILSIAESAANRVVLFLTEEDSVQYLAEHRVSLPSNVVCRLPPPDILLALLDKGQFDHICHAHGFQVPRSFDSDRGSDLHLPDDIRFPLIVKPAVKTPDYGKHFKKAYIVESAEDARGTARLIADAVGKAIVQEWIPGGDEQIYFCLQYLDERGPVASFVGQKLRSWPPMYGGTSVCTAAPADLRSRLTDITADFFAKTGFQGMGSMEFKVDPRDGTPYLIEPTVGRTDFQEEVATINGVNLPLLAYCRETGAPLPEQQYAARPRVWMDITGDASVDIRTRIVGYLTAAHGLQRLTDPGPAIGYFRDRLSASITRRLGSS